MTFGKETLTVRFGASMLVFSAVLFVSCHPGGEKPTTDRASNWLSEEWRQRAVTHAGLQMRLSPPCVGGVQNANG